MSAAECGMCHEVRPPAAWYFEPRLEDGDTGEYAVCAECERVA